MAKVKPIKSFEYLGEIKHPWSEPFDIPDDRVAQFVARRLVRENGDDSPDESEHDDTRQETQSAAAHDLPGGSADQSQAVEAQDSKAPRGRKPASKD